MNEYRYILDKSSKKHHCPECNKKTFVRYIDTETGYYLPEHYGRCDRESKCSYLLNPYKDGYSKAVREQRQGIKFEKSKAKLHTSTPPPKTVYFDFETFRQTLQSDRYDKNVFVQNLFKRVKYPFSESDISKVIQLYRLGTVANGYRAGAVCFPFIDINDNVRTIQVKEFDEQNHTSGTDFLHSIIERHHTRNNTPLPDWLQAYANNEKKVSCLFGEHLLSRYPNKPIGLVEAPKTAVYSWLYFNELELTKDWLWLAVYNKSSFSFEKMKVLQGRFVYVFPDLSKDGSTFNEWQIKAKEFEKQLPGTRFIFSDLLEKLATPKQREQGADMADVLIQHDWKKYRKQAPPQSEASEVSEAQKTNIFLPPQQPIIETTEKQNQEKHLITVFIDDNGQLFIETPFSNTYSIYPSMEHYNKRLCFPSFQKKEAINIDSMKPKYINIHTLKIN